MLLEQSISFDIALVNYGLRLQAKEEELHAIALGQKHNLKVHIAHAPPFNKNFEKSARDFRYSFFDKLMNNYDNLLTAHQLNDQLEWFLMRLTKGAGASELIGLESLSKRKGYTIIRPLLHCSKEELLHYLHQNNSPYFVDKSNSDEKYERNRFRKNFSNKLLAEHKEGIKRSFEYLREDKKQLFGEYQQLFNHKKFYLLAYKEQSSIARIVDKYLKILGYLISSHQRRELKENSSIVLGTLWAIAIQEKKIYIAPYLKKNMPKRFKEACREAKIPPKVRPYLYQEELNPKYLLASY